MNQIKSSGNKIFDQPKTNQANDVKRLAEDYKILHTTETANRSSDSKATGKSAEIAVSNRAKTVSALIEKINDVPDIRAEKVAALRERIAREDYNLSSEIIADAILKNDF